MQSLILDLDQCVDISPWACLLSVKGALPCRSLHKLSSPLASSPASSTRNWILRLPAIPWHNPSQHKKKDPHHRHLPRFMHTSWQVLCFAAAFVSGEVQYLANLDCIFLRGVHQSVIHHFVHSKWVENWPLDSMIKVQFNLSDLLVSCCRKRVMDGGPIVSEAASL